MAGINQHYLPQFLQKGFTIKATGKARYTWWYRKGEAAVEQRIRKIGAADFFYGDPSVEPSADDRITAVENSYAVLLDAIRKGPRDTPLGHPLLPSLIAHLVARTKYVREAALNAGNNLLRSLQKHFPDQERMRFMLLDADQMDLIIEKRLRPDWRSLSRVDREKGRAMYRSYVNKRLPEFWPIWQEQLDAGIGMMTERLRWAFRASINARLAETPSPEAIAERYEAYTWAAFESTESLILGDVACVIERVDGAYRGFDNTDIPMRSIFLPIASHLVLTGSLGSPPAIDPARINAASAHCSWEFFISSDRNQTLDALHSRIGETAEILSRQEAEELAKEIFLELTLS